MQIIRCSVCGYPIMKNGCVHTILGLSAKEWKEKVANEKAKKTPHNGLTSVARSAAAPLYG